ncbi:membrane protein insertase YidC [Rhodobacter sp. Har01]|uniref:membrane protein insertase YidC n=1 Tax=Rhodobacter sp. Har01 TaxID=2883999 RepID=UPI001D05F137|nr:membrane protein insertase YidC [Rhodobacter sp. Har01]MCB6180023.1 membrane protein insertase YidC [Rhodobacter sp. Har01]
MGDNNNRNLILATVLSFLVILVWFVLFPPPEPPPEAQTDTAALTAPETAPAPAATAADTGAATAVPDSPRLTIDTPELKGSISMKGARIDDLSLKSYRETLDPASPTVRLLSPVGEEHPFYAVFGWLPGTGLAQGEVPDARTEWQIAKGTTLAPGQPVTLQWDNGKGLTFLREIAVDEDYLFTVSDTVQNGGTASVGLAPYGIIARHGLPQMQNIFVVHEGAVRRTDGTLEETNYDDVVDLDVDPAEGAAAEIVQSQGDGWIGFTDHYWMAILAPEQGKPFTQVTKHVAEGDIYQTEVRQPVVSVAPGQSVTNSTRLFAGAKEWELIRTYEDKAGIPGFIDSIDWGWFYFLTKPIFHVLHWLHGLIGNMGLAIIALTFVLKLIVLPLAYKSYVSMARMKELQPEMEAIKLRAGEDKQRMQRETLQLYKEKKVNPAAGCLPILIQIPIFFSLYKVIFVTIELRHAPFFGWLKDLSAPDTSSIYNLFGALPWAAPMPGTLMATIFIGVLPILLGITMWLQQKLNPAPSDPVQQQVFAWMPWIFMFMLGSFASGLVVYWIANNIITFTQQYLIMRSHGHRPDIFGNIKSGFRKKDAAAAAALAPAGKPAASARPAAAPKSKPALAPAAVAAPEAAAGDAPVPQAEPVPKPVAKAPQKARARAAAKPPSRGKKK